MITNRIHQAAYRQWKHHLGTLYIMAADMATKPLAEIDLKKLSNLICIIKLMLSVSEPRDLKSLYRQGGFCQQSSLQSYTAQIIISHWRDMKSVIYIAATNPRVYYSETVFKADPASDPFSLGYIFSLFWECDWRCNIALLNNFCGRNCFYNNILMIKHWIHWFGYKLPMI